MNRKFLLLTAAFLCILMGLSACQPSQPVDNSLHTPTQTPTKTPANSDIPTETPETTTEATPTETPETTVPSTSTATKTPTKAPTKTPTKTPKPSATPSDYKAKYVLHVNCTQNVVTVYTADKQGNAVDPVKVMLCSTGRNNGTTTGSFSISEKYTWRPLFGNVYGQYACRFNGHFLFHSVPYTKKDKGTLLAEEFNKLGTQASDGCVRLSVEDCKWIYDNCAIGTKVVVYASNDPEPLAKPAGIKIPVTSTWDPTDPDVKNPWHSQLPVMPVTFSGIPAEVVEVQRNATMPNFVSGITAVDNKGKNVTDQIVVNHTLDISKTGTYLVGYEVKNIVSGVTTTATATYCVVDHTAPVVSGLAESWLISEENIDGMLKERLLRNVAITDDGDVLSVDKVTLTMQGQEYTPQMLQVGEKNEILFTIEDDCGNVTELYIMVTVRGTSTPTPEPTPEPTPAPTPELPTAGITTPDVLG